LPKTNLQNKDDISPPFFKTDIIPKPKLEAYHQQAETSNNHNLKLITDQLKTFELSLKPSTSCIDKTRQVI